MKLKKECTGHRQGTIAGIADWINEITTVQYDEELTEEQKQIKIDTLIREMRIFDITTIGDLYFTSGRRIVLDKGYGEYFTDGDIKLFTLEQLKSGIHLEEFRNKINAICEDENDKII